MIERKRYTDPAEAKIGSLSSRIEALTARVKELETRLAGTECTDCEEAERRRARLVAEAEARVDTLEVAIRWALGLGDHFPARRPEQGPYWWRRELSRRSGVESKP